MEKKEKDVLQLIIDWGNSIKELPEDEREVKASVCADFLVLVNAFLKLCDRDECDINDVDYIVTKTYTMNLLVEKAYDGEQAMDIAIDTTQRALLESDLSNAL